MRKGLCLRGKKCLKGITLLLVCLMILAALGCGKTTQSDADNFYASQEAFLKDMAAGISTRLKNRDDEKERTEEELYAYYEEMVTYELNKI